MCHVKFEPSSTPICIWLFLFRGFMGQRSSQCRVCFESDCCLPLFAFSLRNQTPFKNGEHLTSATQNRLGKKATQRKQNFKNVVLVKALARSKSAASEPRRAFRFSEQRRCHKAQRRSRLFHSFRFIASR